MAARVTTNYFKAVAFRPGGERAALVETFPFDAGDDDDTRRAWSEVIHFKQAQDFARMVLISVWQPIERRGPWSYGVALVGRSREWLDDPGPELEVG